MVTCSMVGSNAAVLCVGVLRDDKEWLCWRLVVWLISNDIVKEILVSVVAFKGLMLVTLLYR